MSEYPNKTDRDEQWVFIEQRLQENDISRSKLKQYKDYFENGDFEKHKSLGVLSLMLYSPELSLERWQTIINALDYNNHPDYRGWSTEEFRKDFFISMQKGFLAFIKRFGFVDADRIWLFTQIYGEVYDPERVFPLIMPGEDSHRKFSFDALYILNGWMLKANMYVKGRYKEDRKEDWFLHIPGYFHSLLRFSDPVIFSLDMAGLDEEQEDFNRYLNKILSVALMDMDELKEEQKKRVLYARKVKSLFDSYKGDLGEYQLLVEKHKNNA